MPIHNVTTGPNSRHIGQRRAPVDLSWPQSWLPVKSNLVNYNKIAVMQKKKCEKYYKYLEHGHNLNIHKAG